MRPPKHKQRSQAGDALEHAAVKAGADLASQPEYTKTRPFVEHAAAGAVPMCPVVHVTAPSAGTVVPFAFAALYIGEGSPLPARQDPPQSSGGVHCWACAPTSVGAAAALVAGRPHPWRPVEPALILELATRRMRRRRLVPSSSE